MQTKLVGVTGLARSGKDSFAKSFTSAGYYRLAFADPLKRIAAYLSREPTQLFFSDKGKEEICPSFGKTRREVLQGLGVSVRDTLGPDAWVNFALAHWLEMKQAPTVITDVRFDNEAAAIRDAGGMIVRIVRPGAGLSGEQGQHSSEAGVSDDLVDVEITNDGTLGELAVEARKILQLLGSPTSFANAVLGKTLERWSA